MATNAQALPIRHYLQFTDLNADEYAYLFKRAALIKAKFKAYEKYQPLTDRTLAMIFEKASTRTRVSFEAGMYQLGGSVVHLTTGDSQLGRAEPIEDSARVISRMVDLVMIRTFGQDKIEKFASHSRVPVINGLTNEFHPCQILADIFTYIEHRGSENEARKKAFADWCVDEDRMKVATPDALFMHCLPAHRGEEVSAEVIDGPQSVVWDEAENRMHAQKALMEFLLLGQV